MANWKDLKVTNYNGYNTATVQGGSAVKMTLQYNADEDLTTTLALRIMGTADGANVYNKNGYYILWAPGTANQRLLTLKAPGETWPKYGRDAGGNAYYITISKSHNVDHFTVPEYWMCNTGSVTPNMANHTITYAETGTISFYDCFKDTSGKRRNFKQKQSGWKETGVAGYAGAITAGNVSITDNGNNTFTLTTTAGKAGTNNPIKSSSTTWGYATNAEASFKGTETKALTIADKTAESRIVRAKRCDTPTYGGTLESTAMKAIKQYVAPGKPGKPVLNLTKNKLTLKESWNWTWDAAKATNTSSPIKGYRIRLFCNGTTYAIKDIDGKTHALSGGIDAWRYYIDRESTATGFILAGPGQVGGNNLSDFVFKTGDKIQLVIHAYTRDAKGTQLFSDTVYSDEYTICPNGIMRIKNSNTWKEGQVYVKVSGTWKEADAVYTKVNGVWKEST